ncbi:phage tail tape measure protein [Novosphingobium sp. 9]|uniref:phage tail tape measure protein n=1 Tax=Novosphingobium sp. 9 TaxID=2025349 RepID=UPI0021B6BB62|nr:phage tail tape measure protein [Novosphingobium sp. 9]
MSNKLSLVVNFLGVDKMSGALRNIIGLGNKGSVSIKGLTGESRKLEKELAKVRRELSSSAGNVTELMDRERDLERQIEGTNRQLARQRGLAAINADTMAMMRRATELKSRGTDNIVAGATMAAPLILATKSAADFSSGMVDIQQKAALSNRETDRMADTIIRAAAAAKQLPEAMRGGVDVLAGLGLDPRTATLMIGSIGRLGTAFKVDISDGANAAYANLNNLKVAVGDTSRALDIMAAADNAGGFAVKDMAQYFPGLTAQMQALGQKGLPAVADLSAALEIARRSSGDADEAANNVKNLLAKINAQATTQAFKKNFGVDLPAALKRAYAQGKTPLQAIAELTQKATGGDLSKIGLAFDDMQAQSAVRGLILGMQDYVKMRDEIGRSSGTIDKAFDQRVARDATVQWTAFMGSASQLAIVLGTTLLPVITQVLGQMTMMASGVASWARAHPQLASAITQGVAALITFRIGLGAAQYALGSLLGPFAKILPYFRKVEGVSAFGRHLALFGSIASRTAGFAVRSFGMIRMAMMFLAHGVLRAGALMLANPIVAIITAIVVAVGVAGYLIYTHWDKIKAAFGTGVAWVKDKLQALPAWLKSISRMMMDGLLLAINPLALGAKLIQMAKYGITQFKNYLGIKSPSRVFMALGGHVAGGLERGIDQNRHGPARAVRRMAAGAAAAGAMSLTPMAAAARPAIAGSAAHSAPIHIHVHAAPGMDVKQLAEEVGRVIERKQAQQGRSQFKDR